MCGTRPHARCQRSLRVIGTAAKAVSGRPLTTVIDELGKVQNITQALLHHSVSGVKYTSDVWTCTDFQRLQDSVSSWAKRSSELAPGAHRQAVVPNMQRFKGCTEHAWHAATANASFSVSSR
jgi:hypothetical protein